MHQCFIHAKCIPIFIPRLTDTNTLRYDTACPQYSSVNQSFSFSHAYSTSMHPLIPKCSFISKSPHRPVNQAHWTSNICTVYAYVRGKGAVWHIAPLVLSTDRILSCPVHIYSWAYLMHDFFRKQNTYLRYHIGMHQPWFPCMHQYCRQQYSTCIYHAAQQVSAGQNPKHAVASTASKMRLEWILMHIEFMNVCLTAN